jgi:hypothetical protein
MVSLCRMDTVDESYHNDQTAKGKRIFRKVADVMKERFYCMDEVHLSVSYEYTFVLFVREKIPYGGKAKNDILLQVQSGGRLATSISLA